MPPLLRPRGAVTVISGAGATGSDSASTGGPSATMSATPIAAAHALAALAVIFLALLPGRSAFGPSAQARNRSSASYRAVEREKWIVPAIRTSHPPEASLRAPAGPSDRVRPHSADALTSSR